MPLPLHIKSFNERFMRCHTFSNSKWKCLVHRNAQSGMDVFIEDKTYFWHRKRFVIFVVRRNHGIKPMNQFVVRSFWSKSVSNRYRLFWCVIIKCGLFSFIVYISNSINTFGVVQNCIKIVNYLATWHSLLHVLRSTHASRHWRKVSIFDECSILMEYNWISQFWTSNKKLLQIFWILSVYLMIH